MIKMLNQIYDIYVEMYKIINFIICGKINAAANRNTIYCAKVENIE